MVNSLYSRYKVSTYRPLNTGVDVSIPFKLKFSIFILKINTISLFYKIKLHNTYSVLQSQFSDSSELVHCDDNNYTYGIS